MVSKKYPVKFFKGTLQQYNSITPNDFLTIVDGSTPIIQIASSTTSIKPYTGLTTGGSVIEGTAVTVYNSLTTGPAVTVTPGSSASLSYTSRLIPNISITNKNVVSGITSS